jgi:hypothetical protein
MSGKSSSVNQSSIAFGTFSSFLLNETLTLYTNSYLFNLLLPLIPSFFTSVSAVLMWTSMKYESPVYLMMSSKPHSALALIKLLAGEPQNSLTEDGTRRTNGLLQERSVL